MSINTLTTANEILTRVAVEIGTAPVNDPYSSSDPTYIQLQHFLNIAGEELLMWYPWEILVKETSIQTLDTDSGDYPLPDDFFSMINQTGWERSEQVPLYGPLSAQDWQYLQGRNLVSQTIYASFRLNDGLFRIYPQPPPNGLDIHYEYLSKNWVRDAQNPDFFKDSVTGGADVPLYDKTLISRYLKVKILEAKGWDTTKAQDELNQVFMALTGKDKGAPVLNAGGFGRRFPYLDGYRSLPDSGYGGPP